jgi:hypothetical protein
LLSKTTLITLFLCRKRKPRKNTTKGWFPKEPLDVGASPPTDVAADVGDLAPMDVYTSAPTDVSASAPMDVSASAPMYVAISTPLVVAAYSPPRVHKVAIRKKLTPRVGGGVLFLCSVQLLKSIYSIVAYSWQFCSMLC